ncbi:MAG: hypothetical protein LBH19_13980 [Dysgonamonadaceae bacterium]|jgi:hypothetical protein|nr:hypothetical protein [Dysgonamonadaceae bacterium]
MKIETRVYVRPSVDVTRVVVETGFAQSGASPSPLPASPSAVESTRTAGGNSGDFYF